MNKLLDLDLWGGHQTFDTVTNTYSINRDCGLFSNITVCMYGILKLYNDNYCVDNIHMTLIEYIKNSSVNLYNILFDQNKDFIDQMQIFTKDEIENTLRYSHPTYLGLGLSKNNINIKIYNTIFNAYFQYKNTDNIILNIINKYSINYNNSILIWARKTDKVYETNIPSLKIYNSIIEQYNLTNLTVFLQTDDISIVEDAQNNYPNYIILNELPFSKKNKTGFHNQVGLMNEEDFIKLYKISKIEYLQKLLSMTSIASRVKYCILYPGNLSTFIPIMKNTFNNCFSFKNETDLL